MLPKKLLPFDKSFLLTTHTRTHARTHTHTHTHSFLSYVLINVVLTVSLKCLSLALPPSDLYSSLSLNFSAFLGPLLLRYRKPVRAVAPPMVLQAPLLPLPPADRLHLIRSSNIVSVETAPFDPATYQAGHPGPHCSHFMISQAVLQRACLLD